MNDSTREKLLKIALVAFGAIFFASSTSEVDSEVLGRSRKSHLMWHISPASSSCSTGERPSSRPDLRTTLGQRAQ